MAATQVPGTNPSTTPASLPDPRPAKRVRDPKAYEAFHAAGHLCLCCGRSYPNAAHLLSRAQGGDDVLPNLIGLCGSGSHGCHGAWHGNPYRGDFGRMVTRAIVAEAVRAWLFSEAGEDARWYLSSRLGLEQSRAWVQRNLEGPRF